jgi:hypothetical protein
MENASLAEFNHRDLIFAKQKENLLGLTFLSRYIVTFDFPSGRVYLKKASGSILVTPKTGAVCIWCTERSDQSSSRLIRGARRRWSASMLETRSSAFRTGIPSG